MCASNVLTPQTFGVGGDDASWSAEGFRRCKWHSNSRTQYGKAWCAGDVIGCWADLSTNTAQPHVTLGFTLNGKDLGDAFVCPASEFAKHKLDPEESDADGLVRAFDGDTGGICPAISLAKDEQVRVLVCVSQVL